MTPEELEAAKEAIYFAARCGACSPSKARESGCRNCIAKEPGVQAIAVVFEELRCIKVAAELVIAENKTMRDQLEAQAETIKKLTGAP